MSFRDEMVKNSQELGTSSVKVRRMSITNGDRLKAEATVQLGKPYEESWRRPMALTASSR